MNKRETGQLAKLTQKVCDFHSYTEKQFVGIDKRFDGVNKRFDGMDERLDKINGKVEKNTTFRNRMYGGLKIGAWMLSGGGIISIFLFFINSPK